MSDATSEPVVEGSSVGIEPGEIEDSERLRPRSVTFISLLGQAITELGPASSVAVLIGFIAAIAGVGTWLSWLMTVGLFLLAAYSFAAIARRYVTTGGLASLVGRCSHPGIGLLIGTLILIFSLGFQPVGIVPFAAYFRDFFNMISISGNGWLLVTGGVVGTFGAAYFAYRDVRLATAAMVLVEVVAFLSIVTLMVIILIKHHGGIFDSDQLSLKGVSAHAVVLGAVFASLALVSFENSATFGQEAKNAERNIPLSIYGSLIYSGALLIFASYTMTLGFQGQTSASLATDENPLISLTTIYGVHWLSYPLQGSIVIALWGLCLALINWTARILFTFAREGFIPRQLGKAHRTHRTPANAVLLVLAVTAGGYFAMYALGIADLAQYGYVASAVTLLYLLAYIVAALVVAFIAVRERNAKLLISASLTVAGFVYVTVNTLSPPPAYPQNVYNYVVLGVAAAVFAGVFLLWKAAPRAVGRFGRSVIADTESAESS